MTDEQQAREFNSKQDLKEAIEALKAQFEPVIGYNPMRDSHHVVTQLEYDNLLNSYKELCDVVSLFNNRISKINALRGI